MAEIKLESGIPLPARTYGRTKDISNDEILALRGAEGVFSGLYPTRKAAAEALQSESITYGKKHMKSGDVVNRLSRKIGAKIKEIKSTS